MKVTLLKIPDVKLIEPEVYEDERGFFFESFNQQKFNEAIGENITFVQDNHSKSSKGVLRGLHYQEAPFEQGKLVRVIAGEVFDVAVDLREGSPTFLKWYAEILTKDNHKTFAIPEGFAHGFQTLSDDCELLYFHTAVYQPKAEAGLNALDDRLSIDWPFPVTERSMRDQLHPALGDDFMGIKL